MLLLHIPETELFNDETNEFVTVKEQTIKLEHSLIAISKWESKYLKPFMSKEPKTVEETRYYIKCMTIGYVDPNVYLCITDDMVRKVNAYIENPMTATKFYDLRDRSNKPKRSDKVMTSEEIYCSMVLANVPVEFEKWHLNRLITLIKCIGIESDPKAKKMKGKELMKYNSEVNAARRKALHSKG